MSAAAFNVKVGYASWPNSLLGATYGGGEAIGIPENRITNDLA